MKIFRETIKFKTKKSLEFIDLTVRVERVLKKSRIKNGLVNIFSRHTTLALRINEREKGIYVDFAEILEKLVPQNRYYRHNDLKIRTENLLCSEGASECLNGHAHCRHLLLGASETIPIVGGKMILGKWQRIFAIELDSGRPREVVVQAIGE